MRKPKTPIPSWLRKKVFKRDNYTCKYCGAQKVSLHADHVYPESKGGETSLENLVAACGKCNLEKHAKVGVWPRKVIYTDVVVEKVVVKEVVVEKQVVVKNARPTRPMPLWAWGGLIISSFFTIWPVALCPLPRELLMVAFTGQFSFAMFWLAWRLAQR